MEKQKGQPIRPIFLLIMAIIVAIRLWLANGIILQGVPEGTMDDGLFVDLARKILTTGWLGELDKYTLVKGPFYPLFLAGTFIAGLPVILAHQILFIIACLVCWWALRPLIRNEWVNLVFFTVLVFIPSGFANGIVNRTFREGIFASLTLLVFSTAMAVLIRLAAHKRVAIGWPVFMGLCLGAFFLTREERPWVYPFLLLWAVACIIFMIRRRQPSLRTSLAIALPFLLSGVMVLAVILVNHRLYDCPAVTEPDAPSFKAAYGALLRVKPPVELEYIPVTKATREMIYAVSPSFRELQPYLEGEVGNTYVNLASAEVSHGEIRGAFFIWAFNESVSRAGYYSGGKYPNAFYEGMADEINRACDTGILDCYPKQSSYARPWRPEYLEPTIRNFLSLTVATLTYQPLNILVRGYEGPPGDHPAFEEITLETKWILDDIETVWGWVVQPGKSIALQVKNARDNQTIPAKISFYRSDDIYQGYLARGSDVPEAKTARFKLVTNCTSACFIELRSDERLLAWLPIDQNITNLGADDIDALSYKIEYYSESKSNVSDRPFSFRLITRVNQIINRIAGGYKLAILPLFILAALACLWQTIAQIRNRKFEVLWVMSILVIVLLGTRLALLAYLSTSLFQTQNPRYLSPLYPLGIIFTFTNCYWLLSILMEKFHRHHPKNTNTAN